MNTRRSLFEGPEPSSGMVLAEIDGLRAVASTSVLVCHAMMGSAWVPPWLRPLLDGGIGVQLFFVISGFLLSLPFLKAKSRGESVKLGPYALRRMLRILPAYYVNLALFLLFLWPEGLTTKLGLATVLAHLTLTFAVSETMVTSVSPVYWTLCVEEQFYLLLPLIALVFARRRGAVALAASLPIPIVLTAAYRRLLGPPGVALVTTLPYHWTAFALGMIIAIAFHRSAARGPRTQVSLGVARGLPILAGAALVLIYLARPLLQREPFFLQAWALGWAAVLVSVLWGPGWLGAPLRWKPVRALGLMTFSIYLWHMAVVERVVALSDPPWGPLSALVRVMTVFLCTLPFAAGSYFLVERPFMDLRRRLER